MIIKDKTGLVIRLLKFNKNKSIRNKIIEGIKQGKKLLLFSFDVVKLYPSIKHDFGIGELTCRFNEQAHLLPLHPSKDCIINLLNFALKNGVAEFNGKHYRKCRGCGMGRCWACFYADLVLVLYDRLLKSNHWMKSVCNLDLLDAGRFRDDLKGIGLGDPEDVNDLLAAFNEINKDLQWELDWHPEKDYKYLEILDLSLHINDFDIYDLLNDDFDIISVDIHAKDTDTHCTLDSSSCHVPHNHRGNIITQAIRVASICDQKFRKLRMKEYACYTIARGHSPFKVYAIFNYYENMSKAEVLKIWNPLNKTQLSCAEGAILFVVTSELGSFE